MDEIERKVNEEINKIIYAIREIIPITKECLWSSEEETRLWEKIFAKQIRNQHKVNILL